MAAVQVRSIVHDVDAAIAFYTEHLGFREVMHPAPAFAMPSRGALRLVLSAPNPAGGGGIPYARLAADGPTSDGVQVGTMHRVKGLEFRAVCIVGCSADVLPQPYAGEDEAAARADHDGRERHLLYVAMTRARELLYVSVAGEASPLAARWDVPQPR